MPRNNKKLRIKDVPDWIIFPILNSIPFFKNILRKNPEQLDYLLTHSEIVDIPPGDVIIRKGECDNWIYFVIQGLLSVYTDELSKNLISYIRPGELFGEIAMIRELERQSTVCADLNNKRVVLFRIDFSPFDTLNNSDNATRKTKLIFYRAVIDILTRRVRSFETDFSDETDMFESLIYKKFTGRKSTEKELDYLYEKAKYFAKMLNEWDQKAEQLKEIRGLMPKQAALNNLTSLLDGKMESHK